MFLTLIKSNFSRITQITFSVFSLIFCPATYAWEQREQQLIDNGCWQYQESKMNSNFLRCFRFDLTNMNPGHVTKFSHNTTALLGCATNNESRWCSVHLFNKSGLSALSVWVEKEKNPRVVENKYNLNGVDIYATTLGDSCYCKVKEWAIETDTSVFYSKGSWFGKEANPIIKSIDQANNLAIYASIPNKYKSKYHLEFSSIELADFKKKLSEALHYIENSN